MEIGNVINQILLAILPIFYRKSIKVGIQEELSLNIECRHCIDFLYKMAIKGKHFI